MQKIKAIFQLLFFAVALKPITPSTKNKACARPGYPGFRRDPRTKSPFATALAET
jgi:hypothetical protein